MRSLGELTTWNNYARFARYLHSHRRLEIMHIIRELTRYAGILSRATWIRSAADNQQKQFIGHQRRNRYVVQSVAVQKPSSWNETWAMNPSQSHCNAIHGFRLKLQRNRMPFRYCIESSHRAMISNFSPFHESIHEPIETMRWLRLNSLAMNPCNCTVYIKCCLNINQFLF